MERPGNELRSLGRLTRADRESLVTEGMLRWQDRGAPIIDEDGNAIGTVVLYHDRLRAVPLPTLCRFLLNCDGAGTTVWRNWP